MSRARVGKEVALFVKVDQVEGLGTREHTISFRATGRTLFRVRSPGYDSGWQFGRRWGPQQLPEAVRSYTRKGWVQTKGATEQRTSLNHILWDHTDLRRAT